MMNYANIKLLPSAYKEYSDSIKDYTDSQKEKLRMEHYSLIGQRTSLTRERDIKI